MKRMLLLSLSIVLWICFVNAQEPQDNAAGNFHHSAKDSGFHKFRPNGFKPGAPGGQFDKGRFAGRFNEGMQQRRRGMMGHMRLTPDQMKQSRTINDEYHKQLADLQKKDKITLGEYKSQLTALNKEHKAKLQAILTEDQKNRIAQSKKQAEINEQVRSTANLERMKLTLGLSDDQLTKIKSNQAALHNKIKSIHENESLLPEQKKEQMKSLMEQQKDIVKSVLTPEQQSKADSLRKSFNFRGGNWNKNRPGVK